MDKQIKSNGQAGFSLVEVMIAITLFAFFITAFMTSQGNNVSDSIRNKEQLILQSLAERKINELILNPPKFTNADDNKKETRTFEETEYQGYQYTLELKRLVLPDFGQLMAQKNTGDEAAGGGENDYTDDANRSNRNAQLEKMIFDEMKRNVERILWQARVTVTNKETKYSFILSTYLTNHNERVQLNVGF